MKSKNFISLTLAFAFLFMALTGIMMYIKQKTHEIEITHTIFGLTFIGFAIFHLINNWSSIKGYSYDKLKTKWNKELLLGAGIAVLLLAGGLTGILEPIAEAGRAFAPKRPRMESITFHKIKTNEDRSGTSLSVQVELDRKAFLPILAVWTEDSAGVFVDNLFVPSKVAIPEEPGDINDVEMHPFDTKSLSTWSAVSKDQTSNFPNESPRMSFILNTRSKAKNPFKVCIETKSGATDRVYKTAVIGNEPGIYKLVPMEGELVVKIIIEKD